MAGTYLRIYSDVHTKDSKLGKKKGLPLYFLNSVQDYLRPNWNEYLYFESMKGNILSLLLTLNDIKEQTKLEFEFVLVEGDDYENHSIVCIIARSKSAK